MRVRLLEEEAALRQVDEQRLEEAVDGVDATADDFAVGDKFVLPLGGFGDDAEIARLVVAYGARWGLHSSLALMGPRFRLEARVVEADADGLRVLDHRSIEDENLELPRVLFKVLASAAHGTGVRLPWQHWSGPFDTADEHTALHYLKAEGIRSMVEEGARVSVADAFEPVMAALAASPTMSRAIETARALVRELGQRGVPDLALARQLRRLRDLGVHLEEAQT